MKAQSKHVWLRPLQILVTSSLVTWLLLTVDMAEFLRLIQHLRWHYVAAGTVLLLICHLLNITRWQYILQEPSIRYETLLVWYGAGLFSNNFLPTGIGGDAVRATLLSQRVRWQRAVFSVGLDRTIGLLSLFFFLLPGLWFGLPPGLNVHIGSFEQLVTTPLLIPVTLAGLIGVVFAGWIAWYKFPGLREKITHRFTYLWKQDNTETRRLESKKTWFDILMISIGLSLVYHLLLLLTRWLIFFSLGIHVSFGAAIWVGLISGLSLLVPVTINGLGLQEGVHVIVLAAYDVPQTAALGAALLMRALLLLFSLLGGILSVVRRLPTVEEPQ